MNLLNLHAKSFLHCLGSMWLVSALAVFGCSGDDGGTGGGGSTTASGTTAATTGSSTSGSTSSSGSTTGTATDSAGSTTGTDTGTAGSDTGTAGSDTGTGGTGSTGGTAGTTGGATVCQAFCTAYFSTCGGTAFNDYGTETDCVTTCEGWTPNQLACRQMHLGLVMDPDNDGHCGHASADGAGVCS